MSIAVQSSRPHQSALIQAGACMKLLVMAMFSSAACPVHLDLQDLDAKPTAPLQVEARLWLWLLR